MNAEFKVSALFVLMLWAYGSEAVGIQNVRKSGSEYIAVGQSEESNSFKASNEACNQAKKELIAYLFGATYQISQNALRSDGVAQYTEEMSVDSNRVILRGVVLEKEGNQCVVHYPVEEALLEKKRLKNVKVGSERRLTELGKEGEIKGGALVVNSLPDDVDVFIDNVRWGTTPLRLNQKLTLGEHIIRLDHPDYEPEEVTVEIGRERVTRIDKALNRAHGFISVKSNIDGLRVKIDGKDEGSLPLENFCVLAGQIVTIEVESPETETLTQTLRVGRKETKTIQAEPEMRPSYISFSVDQADVEVKMDGHFMDSGNNDTGAKWRPVTAGTHELMISKTGYETKRIEFEVRGGEKKALEKINLEPATFPVQQYTAEQTNNDFSYSNREPASIDYQQESIFSFESELHIGLGYFPMGIPNLNTMKGYGEFTCCSHLEIDYQLKIFSWFGIKTNFAYDLGWLPDSTKEYPGIYGTKYSAGETYVNRYESFYYSLLFPISLGKIFYIAPGVGVANTKITENQIYYDQYGIGEFGPDMNTNFTQTFQEIESGLVAENGLFLKVNGKFFNPTSETPALKTIGATVGYKFTLK